jgi:type IV pilus assembly protein PilW
MARCTECASVVTQSTQRDQGVTLIELLVALALLSITLVFVYTVFISQQRTYTVQDDIVDAQQAARISLEMIARDVRSAGYGIAPGVALAISATGNGNPDSITMNVAQGPSTFLTADPSGPWITVNDVSNYVVSDTVNVLEIWSQEQVIPGDFLIAEIRISPTKQLRLGAAPASARTGDLVVSALGATPTFNTITYGVAGGVLRRTYDGTAEDLADQVQDLQFSYVLANGTEVADPSATGDLGNIRMVRITITAQTERDASKGPDGNPLTRRMSTLVRVKNLGVQTSS